MSDTPAGIGVKKETVYGGPGTQPNGGGTVYTGPGLSGATTHPAASARPVQPRAHSGGLMGNAFFVIAAFSAINAVLTLSKAPIVFALGLAITRVSPDTPIGIAVGPKCRRYRDFCSLGILCRAGRKGRIPHRPVALCRRYGGPAAFAESRLACYLDCGPWDIPL